jgi:hypothetical protein
MINDLCSSTTSRLEFQIPLLQKIKKCNGQNGLKKLNLKKMKTISEIFVFICLSQKAISKLSLRNPLLPTLSFLLEQNGKTSRRMSWFRFDAYLIVRM